MALYFDLSIHITCRELLKLATHVLVQMKRDFKKSLGEKIHHRCIDMLEAVVYANAVREEMRMQALDNLQTLVRTATELLRVAFDEKLISEKLWTQSIDLLDSIGKQASGWQKHTASAIVASAAAKQADSAQGDDGTDRRTGDLFAAASSSFSAAPAA